ncbi:MAG: hypothetical protein ACKO8Z_17300 [Prosthecobacter sp.]
MQQALLSFEEQAAFAFASQDEHSFLVAQDAKKIEAKAMRTVDERIIIWMNEGCQIAASHIG